MAKFTRLTGADLAAFHFAASAPSPPGGVAGECRGEAAPPVDVAVV
jgi:hypothetical protein